VAAIEDLVAQITDPDLRMQIQAAVRSLKEHKRFGLVFEEHVPEVVAIPGVPISAGDTVIDRTEASPVLLKVERLLARSADVAPIGGGQRERRRTKDLQLVRRFGEPSHSALVPVGRSGEPVAERPSHTVICGENFHVLQLLQYLHAGSVDCIYIDPPYNTGARDWKYNNDYVDSTDAWRHSKWLAFMERRLKLGRRLLRADGVMIITIDEHEVHNLGCLLRQVFPEARVQMVTIVTNTAGQPIPGQFTRAEEYAYFCFFGDAEVSPLESDFLADSKPVRQLWFPFFRSRGLNDRPSRRKNLVYPIAVDPETLQIVGIGRSLKERVDAGEVDGDLDAWLPDPAETLNDFPVVWPILDTGEMSTWQANPAGLQKLMDEGFVRVRQQAKGKGANRPFSISYVKAGNQKKVRAGEIQVLGREDSGALVLEGGARTTVPKTTWKQAAHDARLYGTTMLRALIGQNEFTYPKSPYAVLDTLRTVLADRPNALIVDFFAGSGTTLQATMMMNADDGGSRRCVLVTNNEVDDAVAKRLRKRGVFPGDREWELNGIFESITRRRCDAAITGMRPDGTMLEDEYLNGRQLADGFPESAEYFRLAYVDPDEVDLGWQFDAILPALWMRAGAVGPRPEFSADQPIVIPTTTNFGVLFDEAEIRSFAKQLARRPDVTHAFLVTDSTEAFAEMRALLRPTLDVSMLYRDYLKSFTINL
jgi:adenine-specific DNA-methyltransferase